MGLSIHYRVLIAFLAVYVIWGSTYLAIWYAVETIPPFLMAGSRFLCAGVILYVWLRLRGSPRPTMSQWASASVIGFFLLLVGNGGVSWAEKSVPSGITALIIAIVPLWFISFEWFQDSIKPTWEVILGLVLGLIGVIVLIDPTRIAQSGQVDLLGAGVLIVATIAWAFGSMYSRKAAQPSRPLLGTAMQMIAGGGLLLLFSAIAGEWSILEVESISITSLLSVSYLIIFGSLIAFSAYIWLLRASTPARVSTYAYVNPVIAVFLGWLIADEPMNLRIILSAIIIVTGVAIITLFRIRSSETDPKKSNS